MESRAYVPVRRSRNYRHLGISSVGANGWFGSFTHVFNTIRNSIIPARRETRTALQSHTMNDVCALCTMCCCVRCPCARGSDEQALCLHLTPCVGHGAFAQDGGVDGGGADGGNTGGNAGQCGWRLMNVFTAAANWGGRLPARQSLQVQERTCHEPLSCACASRLCTSSTP